MSTRNFSTLSRLIAGFAVAAAFAGAAVPVPARADMPGDNAAAQELQHILATNPASADWNTLLRQVEGATANASDTMDAEVVAVGVAGSIASLQEWYQTVDGARKNPTQSAVNDLVNMYYGSYWVFYGDGSLVVYHSGSGTYIRSDLTPTYGHYSVSNGTLSFDTERSSGGSNSANWLSVSGTMTADSGGGLRANVTHEVSVVMSACVMGSCYGQRHYKYVRFVLPVR